jgi:hypothetical protein
MNNKILINTFVWILSQGEESLSAQIYSELTFKYLIAFCFPEKSEIEFRVVEWILSGSKQYSVGFADAMDTGLDLNPSLSNNVVLSLKKLVFLEFQKVCPNRF